MPRQDSNPGGGASAKDAGIIPEPAEHKDLATEVEGLRARIFEDPSSIKSGTMHLRNDARLTYIGGTESSPESWVTKVDFHDDYNNMSVDFGVVPDEVSGQLIPFIERDVLTGTGEITTQLNDEAVLALKNDFDALLACFPPIEKPESRIQIVLDLTGPNTGVTMSFDDYMIATFGKEAFEQDQARRLKEEKERTERYAPLVAEVERLRRRVGIFNPDAFVRDAEIHLKTGYRVSYSHSSKDFPDFWVMSISNPRTSVPLEHVIFGYQVDRSNKLYPILGDSILVPDYRLHPERSAFIDIKGLDAVPKIDSMIDEALPERRMPFFSPLVIPPDNSQGFEETTGLPTPL